MKIYSWWACIDVNAKLFIVTDLEKDLRPTTPKAYINNIVDNDKRPTVNLNHQRNMMLSLS